MLEFYQSEEFRKYRHALLRSLVDFVKPRMTDKDVHEFWKTQGAMEIAKRVLEIPGNQVKGDAGEALRRYAQEDIGEFLTGLIKSQLEG